MFMIPGQYGKDLCDPQLPMTRRDLLRVGGSGVLGLTPGAVGYCMNTVYRGFQPSPKMKIRIPVIIAAASTTTPTRN